MVRVNTWVHKATGTHTKRVTIRSTFHLDLDQMATALVRGYLDRMDWHDFPDRVSVKQIIEQVRYAYEMYGTGAVWAWSDDYSYADAEAMREWGRNIVRTSLPDFADES